MSTAFPLSNMGKTRFSEVESTTLDIAQPLSSKKVYLIKIDVEGAEIDVLKGARALLKSNPFLIIELNPAFLDNRGNDSLIDDKTIYEFFSEARYRQFWIDEWFNLIQCNSLTPFPHVKYLGNQHSANYLFIHETRLTSHLMKFIRPEIY